VAPYRHPIESTVRLVLLEASCRLADRGWVNEHDCAAQAERYRVLTTELSKAGMLWLDGRLFYAASGRPHFMLQPGERPGPGAWENDAEHPTAAGHQALVDGLLPHVRTRL
jgi:hypothetical protein